MKYDKMLLHNRSVNRQKAEAAKTAIGEMLREGEVVTVASLVKKTGLSREYFYKNNEVRASLKTAREAQRSSVFQRREVAVIDRAMETELEIVKKQLEKEKREKESLQGEVQKLKKALKKKDLNLIRKL